MRTPWILNAAVLVSFGCATGGEGPLGASDTDGDGGGGGTISSSDDDGVGAGGTSDGGAPNGPATNATTTQTTSTNAATSTASTTSATTTSSGAGGGAPEVLDNVLMIAGGGSSTVLSKYDVTMNTGFSWPWQVMTVDPVALSRAPMGITHAFLRQYPDGQLLHSSWNGNWMLPAEVLPGLVVKGGPSSAAHDDEVHAAYRLSDDTLAYSLIDNSGFAVVSEALPSPASLGATSPVIAAGASGATVVFVSASLDLVDRTRAGGGWNAEHAHDVGPVAAITPAVLAPTTGPELITVFVREADHVIIVRSRSGGSWGAPTEIPTARTNAPPQLAELATGEIVLSYLGVDGGGYIATWSGSGFGTPTLLVPNVICPPAITSGANGADAELVYIDTIGVGYWSRRIQGQWTSATFAATASPPSCLVLTAAP